MIKPVNKSGGYTIVETIVAVSLFIVVILSGTGALLNANLLHNKSQDMRAIIDSLSFAMEDISKNLRTGYDFQCFESGDRLGPGYLSTPRSCADGWAIAFEGSKGNPDTYTDQWVYYISEGKIFKSTDGANNFIQLTPDEITVDVAAGFTVVGAEPPPGNEEQPFVTIRLSGTITYKDVATPFSLQTSASQRLVDI